MLKHLHHPLVASVSLLAISLGLVFIPTTLAQRVAQQQGETLKRPQPLKTITLSSKGGPPRVSPTPAGTQPSELTSAQREILYKGKIPSKRFKLTANHPILPNKAQIAFLDADVFPSSSGISYVHLRNGSESSSLAFTFRPTVGKLYLFDFAVSPKFTKNEFSPGTFTITNLHNGIAQTVPSDGMSSLHITAYVLAETDDHLDYSLTYSDEWLFFSLEVTEL